MCQDAPSDWPGIARRRRGDVDVFSVSPFEFSVVHHGVLMSGYLQILVKCRGNYRNMKNIIICINFKAFILFLISFSILTTNISNLSVLRKIGC